MVNSSNSVEPTVSVLARDPSSVHRLNANAFQQNAITTFNNVQYAAFYTASVREPSEMRHVTLARRKLANTIKPDWEYLTFDDYDQTTDDGHNTISVGICPGDGTIHVSFDHHCDDLRFRISVPRLALEPHACEWSPSSFSAVRKRLPGCTRELFNSITYPRFIQAGKDLVFEARTGKAGAGSDILFVYSPAIQSYSPRGTYLVGVKNNPYINGMSYADGRLHVSWTYRDFVAYEGSAEAGNEAHKVQAGPNGPENNFDLNYAFSTDCGRSWCNSAGQKIASFGDTDESLPPGIMPWTEENNIRVQSIPKYSGIMNQEAQCVGPATGDFHVLNRDKTSGREQWRHYLRSARGEWSSDIIPDNLPTETGSRGDVGSDATGNSLFFVLPGNSDSSLTVLRRRKQRDDTGYGAFEMVWKGDGFDGEPNIDRERLIDGDGALSVFTRTGGREKKVVVLDFAI